MPEFDIAYAMLAAHHEELARIQVTHGEMHDIVLSSGIDPAKVFRIPIGVDLGRFPLPDDDTRARARDALGLPASAFVVGSFQKDGVGLGEGLEPKLVKGPDATAPVVMAVTIEAPE